MLLALSLLYALRLPGVYGFFGILCCPYFGELSVLAFAGNIIKNILADAADYDIQGIGIGSTGPLDIGKDILLDVENLPTLNYFPLKDTVDQAFPLRVILDNDANALIYAEALWGAGRNAGSVLGFTLGTGIGCAWINGGKVWRGHSG